MSIIVPFQPDGAGRDRNYAFVRTRYETLYPDWEITRGSCEPPWAKGIAVNAAVAASSGDVLVISDADVVVSPEALREAVSALDDARWVVPHCRVWRLNEAATCELIADTLGGEDAITHDHLERTARRCWPGGGLVVMRRETFEESGGIDERFVGWGGEDTSFSCALETLAGPPLYLKATMLHLHHEPMLPWDARRGSPETEALAERYLQARYNPGAMRALLEEARVDRDAHKSSLHADSPVGVG